MIKLPLISIIIPTFNKSHFLIETLESVKAQTFKQWECIVVDDDSIENNVGSINEHIKDGENGFIINNTDDIQQLVGDFVKKINELKSDLESLSSISQNAYEYSKERFDIEIFNNKYKKLLN